MELLAPSTIVAQRYRLERKLGEGGMGSVWLATDLSLDSVCAIKLVDKDQSSNDEVKIRFQREAKAAAQIRSPNVVDVFDHGVWNDAPFIVMEFLQGEDLGSRLDRAGRLSLRETYEIVAQVSRALARAHTMGIVHRDLKPENIFLVPGDDYEVAKVLDFGIAKVDHYSLADKATKTGSFMGTPYYMSPEQARGRPIDFRSDLWALGVIVFQCLTGRPPFESDALGELMGMILYDPIPRIIDRDPSLPVEMQMFWERATAREREGRFQSAKELADALALASGVDRKEIPTFPPRSMAPSYSDSDRPSLSPTAFDNRRQTPTPAGNRLDLGMTDAADSEDATGAPVSRTRRSVLPQFSALSPRQRHLLLSLGALLVMLLGGALVMLLSHGGERTLAADSIDTPVNEPAAPPVPSLEAGADLLAPTTATPSAFAAPSALPLEVPPVPAATTREPRDESKGVKKQKKGPSPAPGNTPDYGI